MPSTAVAGSASPAALALFGTLAALSPALPGGSGQSLIGGVALAVGLEQEKKSISKSFGRIVSTLLMC